MRMHALVVAGLRPLLILITLTVLARAAEPAPSVPGLPVGAPAPAFVLSSAEGVRVASNDLYAKGPVALVFYRSADWCPYCVAQLKDLQAREAEFAAAGVQVVGISYDSPETLAKAVSKHGLQLTLLADVGSRVIEAYGVRNAALTGRGAGVPHPTVFIIDRAGVIRAKLQREGYKDRPEADEIIAAARSLR